MEPAVTLHLAEPDFPGDDQDGALAGRDYGPITPLLNDDTISEVMVNGPNQVYIERKGQLTPVDVKFESDAELIRVIREIASFVGRRIDEESPMVDCRLPDGSRVNAIIPPLAIDGASLTIRKFARDPYTVQDLIGFGSLTAEAAGFLEACVKAHFNILVAGGTGSTTVAATMLAAHRAGIGVFVTGGIGGVHRGASETDDVSSDLGALARFPVAVVCSGAKSILDLARTVERLETLGVPIYGYRCDEFPAFWRRSSGLRLDQRFDDLAELAEAIREHHALGTGTGVVVANPVPEAHELDDEVYQRALNGALEMVRSQGIRGREVTPHILEFMHMVTGGEVVESNVALLLDNARVAGELAVSLANT